MSKEAIWKAFAETGEPVYYLLYKAIDTEMKREKKQARSITAG